MGTNLPTILPTLRVWVIVLLCIFTCISANAHPGHEGGHDGDEFIWTADRLGLHPLALVLIVVAAGYYTWLIWKSAKTSQQRPATVGAVSSPAADTLS